MNGWCPVHRRRCRFLLESPWIMRKIWFLRWLFTGCLWRNLELRPCGFRERIWMMVFPMIMHRSINWLKVSIILKMIFWFLPEILPSVIWAAKIIQGQSARMPWLFLTEWRKSTVWENGSGFCFRLPFCSMTVEIILVSAMRQNVPMKLLCPQKS